jgi:hypothetical protein
MKKLFFLSILLISATGASAQVNTFPATGKVGIGTTAPDAALDVKGRVRIDSSVIIKDSAVIEKQLRVEQDVKIVGESVFVGDAKAKSDLKVLGTTKMEGNAWVVGTFKLKGLEDPAVQSREFLYIEPNGKVVRAPGIPDPLVGSMYQIECRNGLPVWANNSPDVLFTGSQNCPAKVGIGLNNPDAMLQVAGTAHVNGTASIGMTIPTTNAQLLIVSGNAGRTGLEVQVPMAGAYSYAIRAVVPGDQVKALAVTGTGNEEVFLVYGNGNVYATEVTVANTPFPDYVFSDEYRLMTLEELDEYINTHHRLPNMPSADEVHRNGADLGEINRVLVEKVEELTLHTIQLKKELEELKAKLENKGQ